MPSAHFAGGRRRGKPLSRPASAVNLFFGNHAVGTPHFIHRDSATAAMGVGSSSSTAQARSPVTQESVAEHAKVVHDLQQALGERTAVVEDRQGEVERVEREAGARATQLQQQMDDDRAALQAIASERQAAVEQHARCLAQLQEQEQERGKALAERQQEVERVAREAKAQVAQLQLQLSADRAAQQAAAASTQAAVDEHARRLAELQEHEQRQRLAREQAWAAEREQVASVVSERKAAVLAELQRRGPWAREREATVH
jgi:colicin import membrane protein